MSRRIAGWRLGLRLGVRCCRRDVTVSCAHQDFAILITGHPPRCNEFLLEVFQRVVIQGELTLEGAIRDAPGGTEEVARLVDDVGESHTASLSTVTLRG